ncbi:hypothetical protein C8Q74DRAFT_419673 [Fomes fomentarius]|nr:hypothetical protein C8Q74DRAFT_419673 [Fomes fomentarius]
MSCSRLESGHRAAPTWYCRDAFGILLVMYTQMARIVDGRAQQASMLRRRRMGGDGARTGHRCFCNTRKPGSCPKIRGHENATGDDRPNWMRLSTPDREGGTMIVGLKTGPHDEHKPHRNSRMVLGGRAHVITASIAQKGNGPLSRLPSINLVPTATDDGLANIRGILDPIQSRAVSSRIRRNLSGSASKPRARWKFARNFGRTCRTTEREISNRTAPPLPPRSLAREFPSVVATSAVSAPFCRVALPPMVSVRIRQLARSNVPARQARQAVIGKIPIFLRCLQARKRSISFPMVETMLLEARQ